MHQIKLPPEVVEKTRKCAITTVSENALIDMRTSGATGAEVWPRRLKPSYYRSGVDVWRLATLRSMVPASEVVSKAMPTCTGVTKALTTHTVRTKSIEKP